MGLNASPFNLTEKLILDRRWITLENRHGMNGGGRSWNVDQILWEWLFAYRRTALRLGECEGENCFYSLTLFQSGDFDTTSINK